MQYSTDTTDGQSSDVRLSLDDPDDGPTRKPPVPAQSVITPCGGGGLPKKLLSVAATATPDSDEDEEVAGSGSNQLDRRRVHQRSTAVVETAKTTKKKASMNFFPSSHFVFFGVRFPSRVRFNNCLLGINLI